MKIALVHDDLVQWGGAERVLLAISELFPKAPIYTSVFNNSNSLLLHNFGTKQIKTSFIQKIPGWKSMYKILLPLYPIVFEQFDFSSFDLVISQTTRFAKSIITKPETKHICYCHTPPRFLWNFSGEKVASWLLPYMSFLKVYDQISSRRVDKFLAGSFNAQKRIAKVYRVKSEVLQPFVDIEKYGKVESFDGGYYLLICRLNIYKRADVAIKAFNITGKSLKIIGIGPELNKLKLLAKDNIEFLESVSEELLIQLLSGCKALIVTAEEDFGLTSLEAQACGKSVIAYGVGGALETVIDRKTGIFFAEQTMESLLNGLEKFENNKFDPKDCQENVKKFSKENFQKRLKELVELAFARDSSLHSE